MTKPVLYLGGPIAGCTEGEAKDWRKYVTGKMSDMMTCISPLRCEPLIGERYDLSYMDPSFGMPKSILAKNYMDVVRSDFVLCYFPVPPEIAELNTIREEMLKSLDFSDEVLRSFDRIVARSPIRSLGTVGELSWSYVLRKPSIVVSVDPAIVNHPFTREQPTWPVMSNLDEAVRCLRGLFTDYVAAPPYVAPLP